MFTKPPRLKDGATIGIVTPSRGARKFPRRARRASENLRAAGYCIKWDPNGEDAAITGTDLARSRAHSFNELVADPSVDAILAATGGYTANTILPFVDFELFARSPKIVCGFSDTSVLLLALCSRSNVRTFHGPSLLPSFGEPGGLHPYSLASFKETLSGTTANREAAVPYSTSSEYIHWERDDDVERHYHLATPWVAVQGGVCKGHAIAGNLEALCRLIGTQYFPDLRDSIFFLDEDGADVDLFEARITHLVQSRAIDSICGLVLSRLVTSDVQVERAMHAVLRNTALGLGVPALANVDFGHTFPQLTVPLGALVAVDASSPSISFLDASVS